MARMNIGEFIAALRKSSGCTQQEVAEKLGVSNKTVSSWETGISCPDIALLPAIAELFGVTCDELLRGERIPAAEPPAVAAQKREKALALRAARYKNAASTAALVSSGLSAAAVLLTLVLGIAANRSSLGFWLGTILLLAAILTAVIWCRRIRFLSGAEEAEQGDPPELRGYIFRMQGRALLAAAAAFGFILPHAFAPSGNAGMFLFSALTWGTFCAAGTFLLAGLIYLIVKAHSSAFPAGMHAEMRFTLCNALCIFGTAALLTVGWLIFATWWIDATVPYGESTPAWQVFLFFAVPAALFAAATAVFILRLRAFRKRKQCPACAGIQDRS